MLGVLSGFEDLRFEALIDYDRLVWKIGLQHSERLLKQLGDGPAFQPVNASGSQNVSFELTKGKEQLNQAVELARLTMVLDSCGFLWLNLS